jgi:hypothetical protein
MVTIYPESELYINILFGIYFVVFLISWFVTWRLYRLMQNSDPEYWRRVGTPDMQPGLDVRPQVRTLVSLCRNEHRLSDSLEVRVWGEWSKWSTIAWLGMLLMIAVILVGGAILVHLLGLTQEPT